MSSRAEKTRIEFDANGTHYKLEMTAASLKKAERMGISIRDLANLPATAPETVFWIACFANHPTMTKKEASKLFKELKRTADNMEAEYDEDGNEEDSLAEILLTMLEEAAEELNSRSGNVSWSVTK